MEKGGSIYEQILREKEEQGFWHRLIARCCGDDIFEVIKGQEGQPPGERIVVVKYYWRGMAWILKIHQTMIHR